MRTWKLRGIGVEGEMRGAGAYGKKTVNSDDLLRETDICCPTCSEGFRYRAGGDQHQRSEEGNRRAACRWKGIEGYLVNRRKWSAWSEKEKNVSEAEKW